MEITCFVRRVDVLVKTPYFGVQFGALPVFAFPVALFNQELDNAVVLYDLLLSFACPCFRVL